MTTVRRATLLVLSAALLLAPAFARAQINVLPPELAQVGVTEHLQAPVPADVTLRDVNGRTVRLGEYFDGRRPLILNLVYHRCPMLCSMVLNALVNGLRETPWTVGERFDVVTVSIDPTDTPADADRARSRVLGQYGRAPAQHGWHFLVGDEASVRRVANAVGFRYRYDARQQQYAHPAVVMLLTPAGRVARYLYGLQFNPNDLRLGLFEASEGRSMTTIERVVLFCYHYDPQGGKYALVARNVMKLGGVVTMVALGALIGSMALRERARRRDPPRGGGTTATRIAPLTSPKDARG